MAIIWKTPPKPKKKPPMSRADARAYWKANGKPAPGYARCMDCRCQGKGECAGELVSYQNWWWAIGINS